MKWMKCVAAGLAMVFCLSGCGGSSGLSNTNGFAGGVGVGSGSYVTENGAFEDAYDNKKSAIATEDVPENGDVAVNSNRKLITTVSMDVETKEYDDFCTWVTSKVSELGGYVENSDMSSYESVDRSCRLTIRVPKDKLDGFVDELSNESNVLRKSTSEDDVTLDYVDTESHRNALVAEQERLLELLDKAENLEEVLQIEDRLTNVRYMLESMESQIRTYDNQIDYSTLNLSVSEVVELTEPEPETWLERAGKGIKDNVDMIATFFSELGLFIVTHSPALALLGIVIAIIIIIVSRASRKSRLRREEIQRMMREQSDAQGNGKQ